MVVSALSLLDLEDEIKAEEKNKKNHNRVKSWKLQKKAEGAFLNLYQEFEFIQTSDFKNLTLLLNVC